MLDHHQSNLACEIFYPVKSRSNTYFTLPARKERSGFTRGQSNNFDLVKFAMLLPYGNFTGLKF